jgi:hypothetical protein
MLHWRCFYPRLSKSEMSESIWEHLQMWLYSAFKHDIHNDLSVISFKAKTQTIKI